MGGFLPYRLSISNEAIYSRKPDIIHFEAMVDLKGWGTWHFVECEGGTEITFDWRVVAKKAVLRWLSFLLNPLFRANHHLCIAEAEDGIRKDLMKKGKLPAALPGGVLYEK